MLEIVGIKRSILKSGIRKNIIIVDHDIQVNSLLSKNGLYDLQELRVRCGTGADLQRDFLCRLCLCFCRSRRNAAFHYKAVFIIQTVSVDQCRFIILVEEVFLPQRNDFIVDPVQKRLISF